MVERGAPSLELARSLTEPIIARLPSAVTAFVGRTMAVVGAQPLDVFKQVIDKELAGEIPK